MKSFSDDLPFKKQKTISLLLLVNPAPHLQIIK